MEAEERVLALEREVRPGVWRMAGGGGWPGVWMTVVLERDTGSPWWCQEGHGLCKEEELPSPLPRRDPLLLSPACPGVPRPGPGRPAEVWWGAPLGGGASLPVKARALDTAERSRRCC